MKRISLLDILRGVAILGTLASNIGIFTGSGMTSSGEWLESFTLVWVDGKFLGMLTILFGVGLEIKYRQAQRRGYPWPWLYLWSAFLLFLDGLLHYFFVFEFDILMGYALTAMIVAFLVNRSDRVIRISLWISGSIHLIAVTAFSMMGPDRGIDSAPIKKEWAPAEWNVEASWWGDVLSRYEHFWSLRSEAFGIIPMGVFLFLCGVLLMRSGAFASDENGRRLRRKLMVWGIGVGLPLNLVTLLPPDMVIGSDLLSRYVFAPVLSFGYIGLIAWIWEKGWLFGLAARLQEVGRTALSCYMLQNIVASILFYEWGLGLSAKVGGALSTIAAWFGISLLLIVFAHFWLKRFPTGPFEIIWRRLAALPLTARSQPKTTTGN
ncbi:DUF418 domain-containing protein [Desmospora profundinema]|uniref:DUF418 domain-containing protein n=1 Tax=Desmospora profundinema TaxID=1571184 RepID=A0ABU1IJ06_9BACL|nr:DUF418 domain-containing protein [Desmospora profundinema]MDR6224741.1 uncharacterized protein [Desmospora profundinema]